MGLKDALAAEVQAIFSKPWDVQKTQGVPAPEGLLLNANHAKDLSTATVLYADLDGSTNMVDNFKWEFSAEAYKAFLRCTSQIIRDEGGVITAYDGDRVMAVFTGSAQCTSAVRCGLKIHYAVLHIIEPALRAKYKTSNFELKHVVGIDTSQLRTARIGVRGDNDLVWIGRAANYAAKLTNESGKPIWITKSVFDKMNDDVKYCHGQPIWQRSLWASMNNIEIYNSTYWWRIA